MHHIRAASCALHQSSKREVVHYIRAASCALHQSSKLCTTSEQQAVHHIRAASCALHQSSKREVMHSTNRLDNPSDSGIVSHGMKDALPRQNMNTSAHQPGLWSSSSQTSSSLRFACLAILHPRALPTQLAEAGHAVEPVERWCW